VDVTALSLRKVPHYNRWSSCGGIRSHTTNRNWYCSRHNSPCIVDNTSSCRFNTPQYYVLSAHMSHAPQRDDFLNSFSIQSPDTADYLWPMTSTAVIAVAV